MPPPSLFSRAEDFRQRTALVELDRTTHTYGDLLDHSKNAAKVLLGSRQDLDGARVAFLLDPGASYVTVQWAVWRAGGIAVPLATMHPSEELAHVIADCEPETIVVQPEYRERITSIARARGISVIEAAGLNGTTAESLPTLSADRAAMIVYTSGSTGKPKGVVTTHANIESQITSLVTAWEWSDEDAILLTLPLHHVHGIINVLGCSLWSGATCHIHRRFDPAHVWRAFGKTPLTLFMAVPTIYKRLIDFWERADKDQQDLLSRSCRQFRLMVSGSAALPQTTLNTWERITTHRLLERYGMTEIGMALANPLNGERRAGHVGLPLPGVEVKLVDEAGQTINSGEQGELYVRGPSVFHEYWRRTEDTRVAFDGNWFKTGDIAKLHDGYYKIVGRKNVDIIKTGGYKVSALEIEEVLRTHPGIGECAVVGLLDQEWGECVAVAIETTTQLDVVELKDWARHRLAPYKIPSRTLTVSKLPRNAMGKVLKARVAELFQGTP